MDKIIALILAIVLLIPAALLGGNIAFREVEGVDILSSVIYAFNLRGNVSEDIACENPINHGTKQNVMLRVNHSVYNMIKYDNEQFIIDLENQFGNQKIDNAIALNGREVAALAEIIIEQESLGQIEFASEMFIDVEIKEASFECIDENNTRIKAVIAVDATALKSDMAQIAKDATIDVENTVSEYGLSVNKAIDSAIAEIPDVLYVTSTFILNDSGNFDYVAKHESVEINKLSREEVDTLFKTIDYFSGIGGAKEINERLATAMADALIGDPNDEETGFAEAFCELGASTYDFEVIDGVACFVVKM